MHNLILLYSYLAIVWRRITNLCKAYSCIFKIFQELCLVCIAHLNNDTWVLCKQHFNEVIACNIVQIDVQPARFIGESHLQQGGNQTTGTDIMACHYPSAAD